MTLGAASAMTIEAAGLYFDYSKHRITDETLRLLLQLAEESGVKGRFDAMFRGEKSTSPKGGPSSMSPCARRAAAPSSSTERTSLPRFTRSSTG